MQNPNSSLIDQQTVDRWQTDGVVLLKGVFTPWIDSLSRGVSALMANPSEYGHARTVIPEDGSAPFFQDYCNWQRIPEFRDFGRQNVSLWIPLDPVAEEISLRCIRGSHRWDDEFSPTRFNGSKLYSHSRFKELPDIDAHQEDYDIVSWALEPGDAVAFDFRTLHGARGNSSARARRVFSARWVGDDATFADRGGVTSPPFPGLKLRDGEPLVADEFPLVWPR